MAVYATDSDATLLTSDITTNNVSTTKHGFTPKAPNDATQFLDGTGAWNTGAWANWTPSWTNFTVGNGTLNYANYVQIGKTCFFKLKFTLGTTSSVSGAIQFTAPVTTSSDYANANELITSTATLAQVGTAFYVGFVIWASTTKLEIRTTAVNATYPTEAVTSSTIPFTWGSTHFIQAQGFYNTA